MMCLGTVATLVAVWVDGAAPVARLDDGSVRSLAFVPDAHAGDQVLLHLGVPVEVIRRKDGKQ